MAYQDIQVKKNTGTEYIHNEDLKVCRICKEYIEQDNQSFWLLALKKRTRQILECKSSQPNYNPNIKYIIN